MGKIRLVGLLLILGLLSTACAPRQQVPLNISPVDAQLFLDGEILEEPPAVLNLRSDHDHTVFVKRPGYHSELVVLRSVTESGERPVLKPASVDVGLRRLDPSGRELTIEEAESR